MTKPKPLRRFRNISPLGALDVPALGTIIAAGEVFEASDDIVDLLAAQREHYEPADGQPLGIPAIEIESVDQTTTEEVE